MNNQIFVVTDKEHGVLGVVNGDENLQMGLQSCVLALSARYPDRKHFEIYIDILIGHDGAFFTSLSQPKMVLIARAPEDLVKEFLSENNVNESERVRESVDKKDLN